MTIQQVAKYLQVSVGWVQDLVQQGKLTPISAFIAIVSKEVTTRADNNQGFCAVSDSSPRQEILALLPFASDTLQNRVNPSLPARIMLGLTLHPQPRIFLRSVGAIPVLPKSASSTIR
ncbi:helix-turn-helix domain-containing protein [Ktedonobacter sp. SOSP1-85]|uniref:helix-turn-helix domain-containing protein n=1 Tax=Ktedonobacter sp. SOSP1-85 TaxID=2778367 RepID=UPI0035AE625B